MIPQRQQGYVTVEISPRLGVIDAGQFNALADVIDRFGEQMLRVTDWEGALLRWVPEAQLPALHAALSALGLGMQLSGAVAAMVSCTGAASAGWAFAFRVGSRRRLRRN